MKVRALANGNVLETDDYEISDDAVQALVEVGVFEFLDDAPQPEATPIGDPGIIKRPRGRPRKVT